MDNSHAFAFATESFILASYLLSNGCILLEVDKTNPHRASFVFENSKFLEDLIEQFHAYQAQIEPHKFFNAQKDLKQRLYDQNF